jgi:hypothetical protein
MQRRTCTGAAKPGRFTCWRVDPSRAQGHAAFASPGYGPAPISAPFYVYAADGKEYRHWLRADTGYRRGIWASRPLGTNARTSLTWHRGDGLVDVTGTDGDGSENPICTGFCDVPSTAWYRAALDWAVEGRVISGFDDNTFRPDNPVTRAQVVNWLWKLAGEPAPRTPHGFSDVAAGAWFADALSWASGEGLVSGYPDDTFRPTEPVNRAQLAAMLWNQAEQPVPGASASFDDVRSGAWYAEAVAWLVDMGYAAGFRDGTFRPLDEVNRAQAVTWLYGARRFDDVAPTSWYAPAVDWARYRKVVAGFADHTFRGDDASDRLGAVDVLWRTMDAPSAPAHGFSDVAPGEPSVSWAAASGVAAGFPDGTFRPAEPVNRAQAAMMLWKVAGRPAASGPPPFDDTSASAWYADGVAWAAAHGLVAGFADGSFRPDDPVSRAQLTAWAGALPHTEAAWAPGTVPPTTVVFD